MYKTTCFPRTYPKHSKNYWECYHSPTQLVNPYLRIPVERGAVVRPGVLALVRRRTLRRVPSNRKVAPLGVVDSQGEAGAVAQFELLTNKADQG